MNRQTSEWSDQPQDQGSWCISASSRGSCCPRPWSVVIQHTTKAPSLYPFRVHAVCLRHWLLCSWGCRGWGWGVDHILKANSSLGVEPELATPESNSEKGAFSTSPKTLIHGPHIQRFRSKSCELGSVKFPPPRAENPHPALTCRGPRQHRVCGIQGKWLNVFEPRFPHL